MYELQRFGPVVRIRMAPTFVGRPLMWVSAFWVDGLLIDSGCHHTVPDLMRALEQEGLRVEQLVNTHTHEDHIAGNPYIRAVYGVTPRAHALGVARLGTPEPASEMGLYRRLFWGAAKGCPGEALDTYVETDQYRFRVISTPGHAPDHVALWEEEQGWLFSGDLLLSPRLNRIRTPEDPQMLLASMRLVAPLPVRQLFCCHSYKVYSSTEPLKAKVAYWERLQMEARRLRAEGVSPAATTRRLLGSPGLFELLTRGDYSKQHLIDGLLRASSVEVTYERVGERTPSEKASR